MFSKEDFLKALINQCQIFNSLPGQAWQIAENVFAAMVRPLGEDIKWTVIYYFDDREVKPRDNKSGKQNMTRVIQLLMIDDFTYGSLTKDPDDHTSVAYFEDNHIGCNPTQIINYASQLFAKTDNDEVTWFDSAKLIPISIIKK